jgi:hypothetical protein
MSGCITNGIASKYTVFYWSDSVVHFSSFLSVEWIFGRFQQLSALFVPTTMGDTLAYALRTVA